MKRFLCIILLFYVDSLKLVYAQQNLRVWHTQGQTFLLWEHSKTIPDDTTYEIYQSSQPITSIKNAVLVGRVFANNGTNYRLADYIPNARWKLPDSLVGTITVDTNEAYFVVTPHSIETKYYAIVLCKDTIVGAGNTSGVIQETTDSIKTVIQYQDNIVTIYSHWIDGHSDYNSGRPDYPIMGNEYSNGLGFNFAFWKQIGNPNNGPLSICLHGGTQNLFSNNLPIIGRYLLPNGFFVSLDDPLPLRDSCSNTMWFGYNKKYNRFLPSLPMDTDTIIDYTIRRVHWETQWLLRNFLIDSTRISLWGGSMGGNATTFLTEFFPELYSAGLAFVPRCQGLDNAPKSMFGTESQNIPTNLTGNQGVYNIRNWEWRLNNQNNGNWPFTIAVCGKPDIISPWQEKPDLYKQLDSAKIGFALYWDEREHMNWSDTVYWRRSEHLSLTYLARFRNNQSFPAFSGTDLDYITPGIQPDIGDGNPTNGDPWGTWGGYFEWDTANIVDSMDKWAVTVWVTYESIDSCDVPDADTLLANITPRRLQKFIPQTGQDYCWTLVKKSNGDTLQQGIINATGSGIITIPGLLIIKEPLELTIRKPSGIEENQNTNTVSLCRTYPNPFVSSTTIKFNVGNGRDRSLRVYDIAGKLVKTFQMSQFPINDSRLTNNEITWDGKDNNDRAVKAGIYFVKVKNCKVEKIIKLEGVK
ncbi:MAG: T9SS type A sorting domain-containing protein [bacterium]|nr:T9SS type A sorting domain-containing protein [bacterium]